MVVEWLKAVRITVPAIWRRSMGRNLRAQLQWTVEVQIYRIFQGETAMPQKNIP